MASTKYLKTISDPRAFPVGLFCYFHEFIGVIMKYKYADLVEASVKQAPPLSNEQINKLSVLFTYSRSSTAEIAKVRQLPLAS